MSPGDSVSVVNESLDTDSAPATPDGSFQAAPFWQTPIFWSLLRIGAGLVVVLVALLMINRSHAIETTGGTRASVATLGLDPAGVFLGKAAALCVELWLTSIVLLAGPTV